MCLSLTKRKSEGLLHHHDFFLTIILVGPKKEKLFGIIHRLGRLLKYHYYFGRRTDLFFWQKKAKRRDSSIYPGRYTIHTKDDSYGPL